MSEESAVSADIVQGFISQLLDAEVFTYARIMIPDLRSDTENYSKLSKDQRMVMDATLELRQAPGNKPDALPRQQLVPGEQAEERLLMDMDMRRFGELVFGNGNPSLSEQAKLKPLMNEWKKLVQDQASGE